MKKNKILGLTGIRSDYDLMSDVYKLLTKNPNFDFKLIVSGAHLLNKHGNTINQIKKDKIKILKKIYNLHENKNQIFNRVEGLFIQGLKLIKTVKKFNPDLVLLLGDREEAMSMSLVATYLRIPIAHVSGGDNVHGNVDDHIRHAVSKLAHIHFTTNIDSKKRLIKMGEKKSNVYNVGNPGLDRIMSVNKIKKKLIDNYLGFKLKKTEKFCVCIQHPISSEYEFSYNQMKITLQALKELKIKTVIIYPNSDPGNNGIIKAINENKSNPIFSIKKNIERKFFVNILRNASFIIGNSSCGILEAPILGLPAINIGNRQSKRFHASNVFFVGHNLKLIKSKIIKILKKKKSNFLNKKEKFIFGNGKSSLKIVKVLKKVKINKSFFNKSNAY